MGEMSDMALDGIVCWVCGDLLDDYPKSRPEQCGSCAKNELLNEVFRVLIRQLHSSLREQCRNYRSYLETHGITIRLRDTTRFNPAPPAPEIGFIMTRREIQGGLSVYFKAGFRPYELDLERPASYAVIVDGKRHISSDPLIQLKGDDDLEPYCELSFSHGPKKRLSMAAFWDDALRLILKNVFAISK